MDAAGNLVIADTGNSAIRVVACHDGTFYGQPMTTGDIYTIAGDRHRRVHRRPRPGHQLPGQRPGRGDGGRRRQSGHRRHRQQPDPGGGGRDRYVLRQADDPGDIYTIAGTGTAGYTGDGKPAARAELNGPQGLTVDGSGNVVVADTGNYRVRVVAAGTGTFYGKQMTAGDIYTVAGGNNTGLIGDGGPATATRLSLPYGATVDAAGNLVIADTGNNRIRVIADRVRFVLRPADDRRRHLHRSPAPASMASPVTATPRRRPSSTARPGSPWTRPGTWCSRTPAATGSGSWRASPARSTASR